jgi:NAD(P)-dependent dehydrogenase (short-subunit alcohol dehydrogenase family)
MARIALVNGGTRGIGCAIALALKADGCVVAADYPGNDQAVNQPYDVHGIRTYKCDVDDFNACASGIAPVEREIGPIDVLVNNAGIVSDASLHHMTREQWRRVMYVNLGSMFAEVLKAIVADIPVGRLDVSSDVARMAASSPKTKRRLSRERRFPSMEAST